MNVKQLKYFMKIMELGNISKAAEALHMSQPPLSQQLKALEEELGTVLFKRNTRQLIPTNTAKHLYTRSKQIIDLIENTEKEIQDMTCDTGGLITIGFVASSGGLIMPDFINHFSLKYPKLRYQFREGNTYRILELIESGIIELGLVRTPFNSEQFDSITFLTEPMIAVFKKGHFFGLQKSIDINALRNIPIIYDLRFQSIINEACIREGFNPTIHSEGEDSRSLLLIAATGLGVSILPKSAVYLVPHNDLDYRVINSEYLYTKTALVWLKNRTLSIGAKQFIFDIKLYSEGLK